MLLNLLTLFLYTFLKETKQMKIMEISSLIKAILQDTKPMPIMKI